ncbi:hypothetical protein B0H12DRAFT_277076 [Mycena haematopus]|nr:hypothetical protein B0H12DRAFT_277076 [Mycena haematopus]
MTSLLSLGAIATAENISGSARFPSHQRSSNTLPTLRPRTSLQPYISELFGCEVGAKSSSKKSNLKRVLVASSISIMLSSMEANRVLFSDLEARIMDLERSLAALHAEQDLVQERLDAYKYPVLTLPDELISEIFIHFLPIYPAAPSLIGPASPTSLTHICRHWREIAQAIPALWRAIKFVYKSDDIMSYEQRLYICDAWITRSRSCPLSIYMDIDDDDGVFPEALAMVTARWEHLKPSSSSLVVRCPCSAPYN